jgi:hypothetical protein
MDADDGVEFAWSRAASPERELVLPRTVEREDLSLGAFADGQAVVVREGPTRRSVEFGWRAASCQRDIALGHVTISAPTRVALDACRQHQRASSTSEQ